jgi:hypothetical protein
MKTTINKESLNLSAQCVRVLRSSAHVNAYNSDASTLRLIYEFITMTARLASYFVKFNRRLFIRNSIITFLGDKDKVINEIKSLSEAGYLDRLGLYFIRASEKDNCIYDLQSRVSLLFAKDIILNYKNIYNVFTSDIKQYDKSYLLNLMLLYRFILAIVAIESFRVTFRNNRVHSVLNFISGSYIGSVLNSSAKLEEIKFYSYIWGSNLKSNEQLHSVIEVALTKSPLDKISYSERNDILFECVGNLAFNSRIVKQGSYLFDLLLLDTCYSNGFLFDDKKKLYEKLFKVMDVNNVRSVCIKAHPGSNLKELECIIQDCNRFQMSVNIVNKYELPKLYRASKLIINVNSTEVLYLSYCGLHCLNLFPYFINEFKKTDLSSYSQFCQTNLYDITTLEDLQFDWNEYSKTPIKVSNNTPDGKTAALNVIEFINKGEFLA